MGTPPPAASPSISNLHNNDYYVNRRFLQSSLFPTLWGGTRWRCIFVDDNNVAASASTMLPMIGRNCVFSNYCSTFFSFTICGHLNYNGNHPRDKEDRPYMLYSSTGTRRTYYFIYKQPRIERIGNPSRALMLKAISAQSNQITSLPRGRIRYCSKRLFIKP